MSKERVIVLAVTVQGLSKTEAARRYGVSRRWVHTLVTRYENGGLEALEPRSRRPHHHPGATDPIVRQAILDLRQSLTTQGLDAGPVTIAWHLQQAGHHAPSTSTIRRILTTAALITPEPKKRPKSSLRRFAADQPNETWQSDFTHWHLTTTPGPEHPTGHRDVEILNWLDDHSRLLISCTVHDRVTGPLVVSTFLNAINHYGAPQSTLTDNGSVYTSRFTGGRNEFEYTLAALKIRQKNGHPGHPQTQGKIERFHQTLKRWLDHQAPAATLTELQGQLDTFRTTYNEQRVHRALDRATPAQAYAATPRSGPGGHPTPKHFRVRHDHVDTGGKISLRRAGRMHHLGVGIAHASTPVLVLVDDTTATVIHRRTNAVLSIHTINPDHAYWRNTQKRPGRWPGRTVNDDSTHL